MKEHGLIMDAYTKKLLVYVVLAIITFASPGEKKWAIHPKFAAKIRTDLSKLISTLACSLGFHS